MMRRIPKIIHYCWFGPNPIPPLELSCIESWRRFLPDYEIMFWSEESFDVDSYLFARGAYEAKKYAFVSDFVRAKVLYEYGGIYLDSDVEILSNFDSLIADYDLVCGFETRNQIGTALLACSPQNDVIKEFYDFYLTHRFKTILGDNIIANVAILTAILECRGLRLGGERQNLGGRILVINRELFYPKKSSNSEFVVTGETLAIHMCSNSWMSERQRCRGRNMLWINGVRPLFNFVKRGVRTILGAKVAMNMEILIRRVLR